MLEFGAAVALVVGWKTRWAAWVLILYTIILTLFLHGIGGPDQAQYMEKLSHVLKNLGVVSGLFYVAPFGAGPVSAHARWGRSHNR